MEESDEKALPAGCASLSILSSSASAQTLADCGVVGVFPREFTDKDPVVMTLLGTAGSCTSTRVAAVGEAAVLGLPQPAGAVNVILAQRQPEDQPTICPEKLFELEVRLPERLPAVPVPGVFPVGVYRRIEDPQGNLISQTSCGVVDLSVSAGYRSEIPLQDGRFLASVTWNVSGQDESGFAVPADGTADSGLFWFFQPSNWELMVKVLDGCAVNQYYWVIGAAATDVKFTLRIVDVLSGSNAWTYTSPGGRLAPAFADVFAFPCERGT